MALVILSAADAFALTAYVPEGSDACGRSACHKSVAGNQIGAFALTGIAANKSAVHACGMSGGTCSMHRNGCPIGGLGEVVACPIKATGSVIAGVGEIIGDQFILAGALINEPYVLLTMPYRPTQTLS
jgi:hypothetical protein